MENYHTFSAIKMGFILKHMCSMYFKNMLLEELDICFKLGFLYLFSDPTLKSPNQCKTIPFLKLIFKNSQLSDPYLSGLREWMICAPWNNGSEHGSFYIQVPTLFIFSFFPLLILVESLLKCVTHVLKDVLQMS